MLRVQDSQMYARGLCGHTSSSRGSLLRACEGENERQRLGRDQESLCWISI